MNLYTKGMTGAVNPLVASIERKKRWLNRATTPAEYVYGSIVVDISTDCWVWTRSLTRGYGRAYWGNNKRLAHRFSYETFVGAIPSGLSLDHLCQNKGCVNPAHLEPVTPRENTQRANALRTHCIRGHAFNAANTNIRQGKRECITCSNERSRLRMAAARGSLTSYAKKGARA